MKERLHERYTIATSHCVWKNTEKVKYTVGIRIADSSGIQMVVCGLITEWSAIQTPFEYHQLFE